MTKIKFGTDGWRAIIAKDFTTDNVSRVTLATSDWLNEKYDSPSVIIGYDCRFGGKLFAETAAKIFLAKNISVKLSTSFVSTPMVSLAVVKHKANLGIVITASHNPPSYNGFKLKGDFGGPLLENDIIDVESRIPEQCNIDLSNICLNKIEKNKFETVDLESLYCDHVEDNFDMSAIRNSSLKFGYDAMFGAGMNAIKRLLPNASLLHCDLNPSFNGIAPEPIHRNLEEFSLMMKNNDLDCGLATDGDADRIGLYNDNGQFIDSHHIILLLIHYLVKYKKYSGKVVTAFSCSVKVKQLCNFYNLDHEVVKIGFKHIAGKMISENVLLGGEESGGIATVGHIPERDGIWMGLILFEFMAKSGKSLNQLIQEVYDIVGEFSFNRVDLHIDNNTKDSIISKCDNGAFVSFGKFNVKRLEKIDGYKYYFDENTWLMIRPSGTEPVLRTYAEASNMSKVDEILEACKSTIL